jgi:hypothetical protein
VAKHFTVIELGDIISNGHSTANLSNSSTRQNGLFGKLVGLAKFAAICQPTFPKLDTFVDIRQPTFPGLETFINICQAVLRGLARLAKGKFSACYVNLASLASLVNLTSVG